MAYASWFNNKMEAKYNSYEGACLAVVGLFYHSDAIFIVAHSL